MEKACLLLTSLHHQILYNDSPPSNEVSSSAAVLDTNTSPELIVNASSKKLGNDIFTDSVILPDNSFLQLCFVPTANRIDVNENTNGISATTANDTIHINNAPVAALITTRTLKM